MLDVIKKTALGLVIIGAIVGVTAGYSYLISLLNLSKLGSVVLYFAPVTVYLAYLMGDMRMFNSKK